MIGHVKWLCNDVRSIAAPNLVPRRRPMQPRISLQSQVNVIHFAKLLVASIEAILDLRAFSAGLSLISQKPVDFMEKHKDKSRIQSLDYIKSMLGELRNMAAAQKCDMLEYLIEVAYLEASDQLSDDTKANGQAERKQRHPGAVPAIQRDRVRARS
jgi:hypothetical protein